MPRQTAKLCIFGACSTALATRSTWLSTRSSSRWLLVASIGTSSSFLPITPPRLSAAPSGSSRRPSSLVPRPRRQYTKPARRGSCDPPQPVQSIPLRRPLHPPLAARVALSDPLSLAHLAARQLARSLSIRRPPGSGTYGPHRRRSTKMASGFLDALFRRPQRLIVLVALFLLVLSFSTYLSFSANGVQNVRDRWNSLPAFSSPRPNAQNAGASYPPPNSVADMYTHNPGTPSSIDELSKWAQVGDDGNLYPPTFVPQMANQAPRAKAGFIVLVRNSELEGMRASMRDVEEKFNRKYGYPWIFLNNEPFTEEFKRGVRQMTRSECRFGLIPKEHWGYPDFISQEKAAETRVKMKDIIYGSSESYRHMCRYQSGFFFRHELTLDLDYYWRVEPGIKLYCDLDYDPFVFMQMNNKTYGFTMALYEYFDTVPTLWDTTKQFIAAHPEYLAKDHGLHFLTDEPQRLLEPGWNLCHFWSNFEIGDLRWWRSKPYMDYFEWLDKAGGFFYERWGDAPVHSIAVAIMLDRNRLHHFDDIGYFHNPWNHCPANRKKYHDSGRCNCDPKQSFDREGYSCLPKWWRGAVEGEPK